MENLMNVDQVAEYMQVHRNTVFNFLKRDGMPAFKLGSVYRFRKSELDAWIDSKYQVETPDPNKRAYEYPTDV